MMDAIVQLVRNALCCIKDLNLFPTSMIHDPTYTSWIFDIYFPPPMNKTSPLELIISFTQLYACISCTKGGLILISTSVGKMQRLRRLAEYRAEAHQQEQKEKTDSSDSKKITIDVLANFLIAKSLMKEAKFAIRSIIVGTCVAPIGICFFWLFINSLHISEVDWYGGVAALIHALEIMEFALVILLYYMIVDGFERFKIANRCKALLDKIEGILDDASKPPGLAVAGDISLPDYEAMTGWVPFWDGGVSLFSSTPTKDAELKQMEEEIKNVKDTLATFMVVEDDDNDDKKKKEKANDKDEKEAKIRKETLEGIASKLTADIPVHRMEAYREFVYFVLNFIAFYGYLMAPLCFYFHDDEQPYHVHSLKFFYKNDDADWYGNFYGDLMWTIEPMIVMSSPMLTSWIKSQNTRTKISARKDDNKAKAD